MSFDSPTIDQILFHLHYSDGMGLDIGRVFLFTFVAECIAFPAVLALGARVLQEVLTRVAGRVGRAVRLGLPALAVICGVGVLMAKLSVFSWVGSYFSEDLFSQRFVVQPDSALRQPGQPKNLVLIYVESLEDTYGDAKVWGRDLLLPLRQLGGTSFASYRPAAGATWTIAGMVATQCGVPLRIVSQYDVKRPSEGTRAFLPGATCLGDVLQRFGYQNVFLGGAPLSFAGKGKFLTDHGYQVTYGREEWQKEGAQGDALNEWGLYDDELFARAKVKLAKLHASGQRFNLTLLTLDMHNPYGFRSPVCRRRGIKSFEDIVECTTHQTAEFVKFIRQSGYLKDTNVVIVGDHLAVSNPVYEALRNIHDRRIFNTFISEPPPRKNTEEVLPFDMYPTLLEFIGIDVVGDRLGLGYSAFNTPEVARPPNHLSELEKLPLSGSRAYGKLWEAP